MDPSKLQIEYLQHATLSNWYYQVSSSSTQALVITLWKLSNMMDQFNLQIKNLGNAYYAKLWIALHGYSSILWPEIPYHLKTLNIKG